MSHMIMVNFSIDAWGLVKIVYINVTQNLDITSLSIHCQLSCWQYLYRRNLLIVPITIIKGINNNTKVNNYLFQTFFVKNEDC